MALRHVSEYATNPEGILAYARDARDHWAAVADTGPTEWDRGYAHGKENAFQTIVEILDGTERSRREPPAVPQGIDSPEAENYYAACDAYGPDSPQAQALHPERTAHHPHPNAHEARDLSRIERNLFDLAQFRLAQIWECDPESVPTWQDIVRVVSALNGMEDFLLENIGLARVTCALDRMYEPSRKSVATYHARFPNA